MAVFSILHHLADCVSIGRVTDKDGKFVSKCFCLDDIDEEEDGKEDCQEVHDGKIDGVC